jgi:Arc/MetJ-type ribon-helix-helix transcriptional regulator
MGSKERNHEESSLRKQILKDLSIGEIDSKREISVMTRLSAQQVELLDALVKLELFKSRSEAVAGLVMKSLAAELDLFKQLKEQADKLDELQETVKGLATKALRE